MNIIPSDDRWRQLQRAKENWGNNNQSTIAMKTRSIFTVHHVIYHQLLFCNGESGGGGGREGGEEEVEEAV